MVANRKIIEMIKEFTYIHELTGETFKLRSYQKAVRTLEGIERDIAGLSQKELLSLDGIGKSIATKIKEYVETGKVDALIKLQEKTPAGLREIMSIDGVGPKTAKLLYETFDIDSVDKLEEAINQEKLAGMKGIGPKTIDNMLDGIERYRRSSGRSLRAKVEPVAQEIVDRLTSQFSSITEITVAGSMRRRKETIGDLDILIQSKETGKIMSFFTTMTDVDRILVAGDKTSSIIVEGDLQIDLRVIEGDAYYSHLQYFTGSKEHNIRTRQRAIDLGYRLNEYGLFKDENAVPLQSEATIYETLGMEYVIPELREDRGEIEAALDNSLPELITRADIKSDFHVHSKPDDPSLIGKEGTMEAMIEAAITKGLEYLVFTDHTQDLAMVFGLDDERMLEQIDKIRMLNDQYEDIELFAGAELNIRADGTVDLEESTLDQLDFAIASIHTQLKMEEEEMMQRIMGAMDYNQVRSIAHPTTREFKKRDPLPLDFDMLVDHAIKTETALEINGAPERMDLSDDIIHRYRNTGLKFTLGSDAHHPHQFKNLDYGVDQARRGWLGKEHVLNTLSLKEFRKLIK
ncbi:MAG: DNA polymerase/3'-5' exonuclease PolX [Candidatus Kariarchaeaceae archaeon]|jgi:DNA polymerase (family 10)